MNRRDRRAAAARNRHDHPSTVRSIVPTPGIGRCAAALEAALDTAGPPPGVDRPVVFLAHELEGGEVALIAAELTDDVRAWLATIGDVATAERFCRERGADGIALMRDLQGRMTMIAFDMTRQGGPTINARGGEA